MWQWIELVGEGVFWPHEPKWLKKMREIFCSVSMVIENQSDDITKI